MRSCSAATSLASAGLDEAEHIIHEQQDVALLLVAEMFGDGERGQPDPPARARRLVHLPENEHGLVDHTRAAHVGEQLMALARSLADAREH